MGKIFRSLIYWFKKMIFILIFFFRNKNWWINWNDNNLINCLSFFLFLRENEKMKNKDHTVDHQTLTKLRIINFLFSVSLLFLFFFFILFSVKFIPRSQNYDKILVLLHQTMQLKNLSFFLLIGTDFWTNSEILW